MQDTVAVFDRSAVRHHRARAATGLAAHDFLFREIGERLADRLVDVKRRFPLALDLGCHSGQISALLRGRGGIRDLIQSDLAHEMVARAEGLRVVADEEFMPFADHSLDLVLSNLSLHWVNDLPGALIQIRRMLRPDGLFLASLLGGETLIELRGALLDAELEVRRGAAPRVSPFADLRDAGALLQRAGFALPVVDTDTVTVTYDDATALMRDLRGMGETNAVRERPGCFTRRDVLARACAIYATQFGDTGGRIRATFQIIYLTGWAPDFRSQQQPLRPGSATARLADALGVKERPAGDKTPRPKS